MSVEPSRCAVIEDSAYGIQAALAAGMRAYGYAGGVTPGERLLAAGANVALFENMSQLLPLLEAG